MKYISNQKIEKLISENKIILYIGNHVYDVTNFKDHPGGYNILQNRNNKDISNDFKFHRNKKLFEKYLIGTKKNKSCGCIIS